LLVIRLKKSQGYQVNHFAGLKSTYFFEKLWAVRQPGFSFCFARKYFFNGNHEACPHGVEGINFIPRK